jgi:hypothetical protein
MLYLWKITQSENLGYDTYDSAVVVAETEEQARKVHPSEYGEADRDGKWPAAYGWASTWKNVSAERLAPLPAESEYKAGAVIVASFNAG